MAALYSPTCMFSVQQYHMVCCDVHYYRLHPAFIARPVLPVDE